MEQECKYWAVVFSQEGKLYALFPLSICGNGELIIHKYALCFQLGT
jgi:hypothetical protein